MGFKSFTSLGSQGLISASVKNRTLAKGIYGVKLLNDKYTGAIFNIRRGSDNVTEDFFYTNSTLSNSSGTSLSTFLSGSIAYITIWYDQSLKGNNGTQTNLTLQPIYNPTNLYVDFIPNRTFTLPDGTVPFGNSDYTITIKHNVIDVKNLGTWLSSGTFAKLQSNNFRMTGNGEYFNYWFDDPGTKSTSSAYAVGNTITYQYDGTNVRCYVNLQLNSTSTPSVLRRTTSINNLIGARQNNGEPLNGQLYYVYIYDYPLTQIQRSKIEL